MENNTSPWVLGAPCQVQLQMAAKSEPKQLPSKFQRILDPREAPLRGKETPAPSKSSQLRAKMNQKQESYYYPNVKIHSHYECQMESASNCSTWQNNYTGACKELCQTSPFYYNNRKFSPAFNVACVYNTSFRKITTIFVLQVGAGQVRDLWFVSEVETELESFVAVSLSCEQHGSGLHQFSQSSQQPTGILRRKG